MSSSEPPPGGQPPGPGSQPPGGYPPPGGPPPGQPPQGPPPGGGYPPPGPPPGGYPPQGPPPGGGYPPQGPPPPGGYPGQGGYGPPPQRFSVGEAFNYGWTKFQQNVGTILLAALGWAGIFIAVYLVWFLIFGAIGVSFSGETETNAQGEITSTSDVGFGAFVLAFGLYYIVMAVVGLLMQAGITRGSLAITYGRELRVSTMFTFANLGAVVVSALLIAVMTTVGFILCFVPGLIVWFFTQYTMFFIVDKDMSALEGIKASASFVNRNLGTLIGFFIVSIIAYIIGALLCGIGLLVALPVTLIAQTYAYRVLQGETVAP